MGSIGLFYPLLLVPRSFNNSHSPILEDNHSNKCNASQYQRASPIGQGTRKEEGLTTDHNDGEESSPWWRCRLALKKSLRKLVDVVDV